MQWFSGRRDGFVLGVLLLLIVMLGAGLTGAYRTFAYAFVGLAGLFTGLGFIRRGRPATYVPPIVATLMLAIGLTGMFVNESRVVESVDQTTLGFHPGTAFLIYVVWIPAFFTLGVSFAVLFHQVAGDMAIQARSRSARRQDRTR